MLALPFGKCYVCKQYVILKHLACDIEKTGRRKKKRKKKKNSFNTLFVTFVASSSRAGFSKANKVWVA